MWLFLNGFWGSVTRCWVLLFLVFKLFVLQKQHVPLFFYLFRFLFFFLFDGKER